jgi:hypothetical protein
MTTRSMTRTLPALVAVSLLALAACTSSASIQPGASTTALNPSAVIAPPASAAASTAASLAPSAAPLSSPEPSVAASSGPTAVPTAIDPCQLVTKDEANKLAAASFADGKEEENKNHLRNCTYGAQTKNVFMVDVLQAPDAATAKAAEAGVKAEFENSAAKGKMSVQEIAQYKGDPNTDCAILRVPSNALQINGIAMYCVKGAVFTGFSDLKFGSAAPGANDVETQMDTVLGRIPLIG